MLPRSQIKAEFFLVFATLGWGINYPLMKMGLQLEQGTWFLFMRFLLSFLLLSPLLWLHRQHINAHSLKAGLICGLIFIPCVQLMNWGLHHTTASNAGFIFALFILWVPLTNALFFKTPISNPIKISMALGITGLAIIAQVHKLHLNIGDLAILICSLGYTFYILALDRYSTPKESTVITVIQLLVLSIGCMIIYSITKPEIHHINWSWQLIGILVLSTLLPSTFATWAQTRYQPDTTPERATLIFNLEPVFATIFAVWWLHEALTINMLIGGSLILAAMVWPNLAEYLHHHKLKKNQPLS